MFDARETTVATETGTSWFFERLADLALSGGPGCAYMAEREASSPGAMTPLHVRDEEEIYRVVEGEIAFWIGDEPVVARSGDVIVAPAGVARTLRIESQRARWLVATRVDSLAAYEDFGRAIVRPAGAAWPSDDEAAALAQLAAANGIRVLAPPGRLPIV